MAIEASRSTLPDSSFSTISSSSASAVSKFIPAIGAFSFAIFIVLVVKQCPLAAAPDQRLDMHGDRSGQRAYVIAALEHRHNAAFGMFVSDIHEIERGPDEILLGKIEAAQRILAMRIEAGRDDDEIGAQGIERRQDRRSHGGAELRPTITCIQGGVENIADAGFRNVTGAGLERHLVGRAIEEIMVGPEDVLRAI